MSAGAGIAGTKFGLLTLVEKLPGGGRPRWRCACDCGREIEKRLDELRTRMIRGSNPSCGCQFAEERSRVSLAQFDPTVYMQKRYGRLLVTGVDVNVKRNRAKNSLVCLCDCGSQVIVRGSHLLSGSTKSCGCFQRDQAALVNFDTHFIHGKTIYGELDGVAPIYKCWTMIKQGCFAGHRRGVHRVCHEYDPRWEDFKEFYEDFGDIKVSQTVSRINNQLPWSKDNCFINVGRRIPRKNVTAPILTAHDPLPPPRP